MRGLILFLLFANPALGWEAKIGSICTLSHEEAGVRMYLTYDPGISLYSIAVSRPGGWSSAPVFGMTFDGPNSLTITSSRHALDGDAVTVTDTGFGNVLNGLAFNRTATAFLGDQTAIVSLDGAAPEVAAFQACTTAPSV